MATTTGSRASLCCDATSNAASDESPQVIHSKRAALHEQPSAALPPLPHPLSVLYAPPPIPCLHANTHALPPITVLNPIHDPRGRFFSAHCLLFCPARIASCVCMAFNLFHCTSILYQTAVACGHCARAQCSHCCFFPAALFKAALQSCTRQCKRAPTPTYHMLMRGVVKQLLAP